MNFCGDILPRDNDFLIMEILNRFLKNFTAAKLRVDKFNLGSRRCESRILTTDN